MWADDDFFYFFPISWPDPAAYSVISQAAEPLPLWHREFRRNLPSDPLLHTDVYEVKVPLGRLGLPTGMWGIALCRPLPVPGEGLVFA